MERVSVVGAGGGLTEHGMRVERVESTVATGASRARHLPLALLALTVSIVTIEAAVVQPQFRGDTELVVVPVVVTDRVGKDVTTLGPDDFEVREDGRPVAIETFVAPGAAAGEPGRFVVVVIDNVNVAPERFWLVRSLATKIVDRAGPDDRMVVAALSGGAAVESSSRAALRTAVAKVHLSAGGDVHPAERNADDGLRMLIDVGRQIGRSAHRRKVVVVIGAAWIFNPNRASAFHDRGPELSARWGDATDQAGEANAAFYLIDPSGFSGTPQDYATSFAASTGGLAWTNSNNYDRAIERLWNDAGSYYLLGYRPPIRDARPHAIDVRVSAPGLTVRARRVRG